MATIEGPSTPALPSGSEKDSGPAPSKVDYYLGFRTHFQEFSRYLAEYLPNEPLGNRTRARQKLLRLWRSQFFELSTDVYDDVLRRTREPQVLSLPSNPKFHSKRNTARMKLATLPEFRMRDLCSDVYHELARRYPEFESEAVGMRVLRVSFDAHLLE